MALLPALQPDHRKAVGVEMAAQGRQEVLGIGADDKADLAVRRSGCRSKAWMCQYLQTSYPRGGGGSRRPSRQTGFETAIGDELNGIGRCQGKHRKEYSRQDAYSIARQC
jgi:hypothetical protein